MHTRIHASGAWCLASSLLEKKLTVLQFNHEILTLGTVENVFAF